MGDVFGTCPDPTLLLDGVGGILEWINDPAVSIREVRPFLSRVPIVEARNGTARDIGELSFRWRDAAATGRVGPRCAPGRHRVAASTPWRESRAIIA